MNPDSASGSIVQEIIMKAPAERIFEALPNPGRRLKWWWRSEGRFVITRMESDLRPGGKWIMRDTALVLFTSEELQTLVAHEIGHEYVLQQYRVRRLVKTRSDFASWNLYATQLPSPRSDG